MGKRIHVKPVKLTIGFIFKEEINFKKAKRVLIRKFGKIDFESEAIRFNFTDYYEPEFGGGLKRAFVSFRKLIHPRHLSRIKVITNEIERKLSLKNKRVINIDPGYLDLAKLILASTKDYAHRIYLDKGIFAEVTLAFKGNSFRAQEWTYPDYRTEDYISIFNKIRGIYSDNLCQLTLHT
ncbi:MAG: DUF4416 domain-containing protein [Candidatus Omnitrophica bacterium CG08_land_8_20_14_0_20_41_16]|uniref:GTP-binding protein n=1 Tax=Candidatus Sherwoodlollariibacterium unditelluris TaxID=1974757 RepID=A0A2G9YM84_9BACT|nr:MAG: hypothetical protein COX41_00705 [Candidatus Omnitrophica bacterium CG23_combo_of_CG06-09_8_20_14_all_41_10]PIS33839.1 MAG: DUF4416 domain-containing protein [Candidatus Omnitrophica bacterium CG08_land_8_20_14_0_20_41_16]